MVLLVWTTNSESAGRTLLGFLQGQMASFSLSFTTSGIRRWHKFGLKQHTVQMKPKTQTPSSHCLTLKMSATQQKAQEAQHLNYFLANQKPIKQNLADKKLFRHWINDILSPILNHRKKIWPLNCLKFSCQFERDYNYLNFCKTNFSQ